MCGATRNVRYGPKADIAALFDHLVGACEHRWRDCEAEGLSCFEIDHHFVLVWCLHGQISRLFTFEDAVDIAGREAILVNEIRSIRNQSAVGDELSLVIDRGEFVSSCKGDD